MLRELRNNNKGVVFLTVLMIIVVLMGLAISAVSLNISQSLLTQKRIRDTQAKILAMGALARTFANQLSNSAGNYIAYNETLDGHTFQVISFLNESGGGIDNTDVLSINIVY